MGFGERISELRKDRGLKQKDIAILLNVAVSTVSNYETDSHEPDLENLCKLADLLGVSTDYLLGIEDKKQTLDITDLKDEDIQFLQDTIQLLRKKNLVANSAHEKNKG